jgi:DNA-binding CsgD family transcriptional regulator
MEKTNQSDPTVLDFFKGIPESSPTTDAGEGPIAYDFLSSMMTEAFVVLDFEQKNFRYNFSFLLRVKSAFPSNRKSDYLMTCVKLKPQWLNEQLRYGICLLSPSVIRKPGHQLCVHYKNMDYSDYSFKTKKWKHHQFSPLSKRQKEMLVCAQHGFSLKETAEKMNVAEKTTESIRQTLLKKFGVNTIEQAIQYASNRRLICHSPPVQPGTARKTIERKVKKQ